MLSLKVENHHLLLLQQQRRLSHLGIIYIWKVGVEKAPAFVVWYILNPFWIMNVIQINVFIFQLCDGRMCWCLHIFQWESMPTALQLVALHNYFLVICVNTSFSYDSCSSLIEDENMRRNKKGEKIIDQTTRYPIFTYLLNGTIIATFTSNGGSQNNNLWIDSILEMRLQ